MAEQDAVRRLAGECRLAEDGKDFVVSPQGVLTEYCGSAPKIMLPETVKEIGANAFLNNDTVKAVVIPPSVRAVGRRAFFACRNLTAVVLPDSLAYVGERAFSGCERLEEIYGSVPCLETVEEYAFSDTPWFRRRTGFIILGNTLLGYVPEGSAEEELAVPSGIRYTCDRLFFGPEESRFRKIIFPPTLERVGKRQFYYREPEEIDLGGNVRAISDYAFYSPKPLKVANAAKVVFIGHGAFPDRVSFEGEKSPLIEAVESGKVILFPDSRSVAIPCGAPLPEPEERSAYEKMKALLEGAFPDHDVVIETPWYSSAQRIASEWGCETRLSMGDREVYSTVFRREERIRTEIGKRDFRSASAIVLYPEYYRCAGAEDSVEDCFYQLLTECRNVRRIELAGKSAELAEADGVLFTRIRWMGRKGAEPSYTAELAAFPPGREGEYRVPEGTAEISSGAFTNCRLSGIRFPASLETIGEFAFVDCDSLRDLSIPAGVYITHGDESSPVIGGASLRSVTVESGHIDCFSYDGCLYRGTELLYCPGGREGEVVLPSFCSRIGRFAFRKCGKVTRIDLSGMAEGSVIEDYAFMDCTGLASVTLPAAVKRISASAFSGCSGLKDIYVENSRMEVEDAEEYGALFEGAENALLHAAAGSTAEELCGSVGGTRLSLAFGADSREIAPYAYSGREDLAEVAISEGAESIREYAFGDCCALERAWLPESVRYLGEGAFAGCGRLTLMVYKGSHAHRYALDNGFPYVLRE